MKFDITIGNPPYNDESSTRIEGTNFRSSGGKLFNRFAEYLLERTKEHTVVVGPGTNKTYGNKQKREWRQEGLYEVKNVKKYFPAVKLTYILTYTFDKTQQRELDDCTYFQPPENNLGELYSSTVGIFRKDYDHLLKDEGKYKVYVTTSRVKYTDDLQLAKAIYPADETVWRVLVNQNASVEKIGKVVIAEPGSYCSYSTVYLPVANREEAEILKQYLESDEVAEISKRTRRSTRNSKYHFSAIPNPIVR